MTNGTHVELAKGHIAATRDNSEDMPAPISALLAVAHALLAVRDQLHRLSLPPDQR
jgi:hypothetical protein